MKGDKLALLVFLGIVFALTGIMGAAAYSYYPGWGYNNWGSNNYWGGYNNYGYNNYYSGAYRYSYNWNQPMPMYYGPHFAMGWYAPRYYSYYQPRYYSTWYSSSPCGYWSGCW